MTKKLKDRLLAAACGLLLAAISADAAAKSPNIVIILADDLGYGDLGCYGHPTIRTPNLDRMAAEGLRFTQYYAPHNLCTPSRAALLTGRLAIRSGMAGDAKHHVLYPNSTGGLPAEEITIAKALKGKDYATACIGKWHLGSLPQFLPVRHGFDYFFGLPYSNDMDPVNARQRQADSRSQNPDYHNFNVPLMRQDEIIERPAKQDTLTRRYTEEALAFIHKNREQPFFLYFAHTFPHVPLFASEDFRGKSRRGLFGDAVEEVDWSVGEVIKALRTEKLVDNTLVFFTSDNGPWLIQGLNGGSAGLLRDGKGGTWEGGHRVPAIAWWPGKIKPGRVTSELACGMDLFNTSLELAGVPVPRDRVIDGVDMRPILFEQGPSRRDTLFFYAGADLRAIRKGGFKAHFVTQDGYSKVPEEKHDPPLLMQLERDPSEKLDQAKDNAEPLEAIQKELEKHRANLVPGKPQY